MSLGVTHEASPPACKRQRYSGAHVDTLEVARRRRLGEVQALLAKEVVLWRRGALAMPQVSALLLGHTSAHEMQQDLRLDRAQTAIAVRLVVVRRWRRCR